MKLVYVIISLLISVESYGQTIGVYQNNHLKEFKLILKEDGRSYLKIKKSIPSRNKKLRKKKIKRKYDESKKLTTFPSKIDTIIEEGIWTENKDTIIVYLLGRYSIKNKEKSKYYKLVLEEFYDQSKKNITIELTDEKGKAIDGFLIGINNFNPYRGEKLIHSGNSYDQLKAKKLQSIEVFRTDFGQIFPKLKPKNKQANYFKIRAKEISSHDELKELSLQKKYYLKQANHLILAEYYHSIICSDEMIERKLKGFNYNKYLKRKL